jgi:signal transduction histidine kinase
VRHVLDWLHRCLLRPDAEATDELAFLRELSQAFASRGAGLAHLAGGLPIVKHRSPSHAPGAVPSPWPWEEVPQLLRQDWSVKVACRVDNPQGRPQLITGTEVRAGSGWLLWLEDDGERARGDGDKAALALAARLWAWQRGVPDRGGEPFPVQRRLDEAGPIARRLAHDFGNILTGVVGFGELALTQLPRDSAGHLYVRELLQSAQGGARLVKHLSAFSRSRPSAPQSTPLRLAAAEEVARVMARWAPKVAIRHQVPAELPALAIDALSLAQVLGQLLDNACEAVAGGGEVTLAARPVELTAADCGDFLGRPAPGGHVEVTVADTGPGIAADDWRRLVSEPFYTTRSGQRGYGLAVVYGILRNYQGGFLLRPGPEGGTTVRVVLPRAGPPAPAARVPSREPQPSPTLVIG